MPKGIGYQAASKMSAFRRKKSKDEKALKKPKRNKATERVIKRLKDAGLSDEDIKKLLDKGAK